MERCVNGCIYVVGCIVCSIPPLLIILGLYSIFSPNYRQELVDGMNRNTESWQSENIASMRNFNIKSISFGSYGEPNVYNKRGIDLELLRSDYDDPSISDWQPYYFGKTINLGNKISYFSDTETIELNFFYSDGTVIRVREKLWIETSTAVSEQCVFTKAGESKSGKMVCVSPKVICEGMHGEYEYLSIIESNCKFRYKVNRICLLIDPETGRPDLLYHNDGGNRYGNIEMSSRHGCFRYIHFAGLHDLEFRPGDYKLLPHIDKKNLSGNAAREKEGFLIDLEFRSRNDPEIVLNLLTNGRLNFGRGEADKTMQGILILLVGLVPCCVGVTFVVCYGLSFINHFKASRSKKPFRVPLRRNGKNISINLTDFLNGDQYEYDDSSSSSSVSSSVYE